MSYEGQYDWSQHHAEQMASNATEKAFTGETDVAKALWTTPRKNRPSHAANRLRSPAQAAVSRRRDRSVGTPGPPSWSR